MLSTWLWWWITWRRCIWSDCVWREHAPLVPRKRWILCTTCTTSVAPSLGNGPVNFRQLKHQHLVFAMYEKESLREIVTSVVYVPHLWLAYIYSFRDLLVKWLYTAFAWTRVHRLHGVLASDYCSDVAWSAVDQYYHVVSEIIWAQALTCCRVCECREIRLLADKCPNLEQLDLLGNSSVTMLAVAYLLEHCRKLVFLDISFCNAVHDTHIDEWKRMYPHVVFKKSTS